QCCAGARRLQRRHELVPGTGGTAGLLEQLERGIAVGSNGVRLLSIQSCSLLVGKAAARYLNQTAQELHLLIGCLRLVEQDFVQSRQAVPFLVFLVQRDQGTRRLHVLGVDGQNALIRAKGSVRL